jgi:hypothetical protein
LPAHPLPRTRAISKSDTCTLRETRSLVRIPDLKRFLCGRRLRGVLSKGSPSIAEADADADRGGGSRVDTRGAQLCQGPESVNEELERGHPGVTGGRAQRDLVHGGEGVDGIFGRDSERRRSGGGEGDVGPAVPLLFF